jgi:sugar lactone lactonase YvrE
MRIYVRALSAVLSAGVVALVAGCGSSPSGTVINPPPPPPDFTVTGKVVGGQQPVGGAEVEIFAAGASGYGSGGTLLANAATTDASGNFTLDGNVACPSASAPIYITASGGTVGSAASNSAIGMMAAIGTCGSLSTPPTITVDEVTTVAAVWALAPFLKAGGHLGTSSGNAQGLVNAFDNVNNLVTLATGAAPGTSAPANATIPTTKINTLADILAACVDSSSSTACSTLFAAATPAGGSAPDNTLDAALSIARNPGSNVAALFALASTAAPFQPALTAAPPDWTLAVTYKGGGLSTPGSIALDATGNVWVANYFASVTELSNSGQVVSPAGGFTGGGLTESYGLTANSDGSVWVTDEQSTGSVNGGEGSVTVLNSAGTVTSGASGYSGGGVFFPIAAAADTDGSVWIANYGDSSATRFSLAGSAISSSTGFGSGQLEGPVAVAIDASHNAWFANQAAASGSVTSISADGTKVNTIVVGGEAPSGIATDSVADSANAATGHVWTANYYTASVSELALHSDGSMTVVSTGYTGGGLEHPNGIAVDGAGNVWVGNYRGSSITELAGAGSSAPGTPISPSTGFGSDASLTAPFAVAVDASGNVWVSNQGSSTITQFVGTATPVKTPVLGPPQLP